MGVLWGWGEGGVGVGRGCFDWDVGYDRSFQKVLRYFPLSMKIKIRKIKNTLFSIPVYV